MNSRVLELNDFAWASTGLEKQSPNCQRLRTVLKLGEGINGSWTDLGERIKGRKQYLKRDERPKDVGRETTLKTVFKGRMIEAEQRWGQVNGF
jgi:hypothetical protein